MGARTRMVVAAAIGALAAVPAAAAGKPVILTPPPATLTGVEYAECTQGFAVTASFTVDRRRTLFLEGEDVVKEIRQVHWDGMLTGNGKSLPYGGTVTFTFDFVAGTLTKTGRFRYSKPDHGGLVVQDTGRTVENIDSGAIESDTAGTIAEFDSTICALLAG